MSPLPANHIVISRVVRSRRRSICLEVSAGGTLTVRAPLSAKDSVIQSFVRSKEDWIRKAALIAEKRFERYRPKNFSEGEMFPYLGSEYPLHIADDMYGKFIFEDRFILSARHAAKARKHFECWYREEAFSFFTGRCQFYAPKLGVRYKSIALSNARGRWGSCHSRGSLRFCWRLVMAPREIIDYVVVHELAHLKEHNHSRNFWALVESVFPSYKDSKKWLNDNQHSLNL